MDGTKECISFLPSITLDYCLLTCLCAYQMEFDFHLFGFACPLTRTACVGAFEFATNSNDWIFNYQCSSEVFHNRISGTLRLRKRTWIFYDGTVKKISAHTAPSALLAVRYLGCRVATRQAIRSDGPRSIGASAYSVKVSHLVDSVWKKFCRRRGYTRPAADRSAARQTGNRRGY